VKSLEPCAVCSCSVADVELNRHVVASDTEQLGYDDIACEGMGEGRRVLRRGRTLRSAVFCRASPSTEAPRRGRSGRLLPSFDDADRDAPPHVSAAAAQVAEAAAVARSVVHVAVVCCVSCVLLLVLLFWDIPSPCHPPSFCVKL